jgi:2-oxoglutarate ferredoxin oxidoreductase subunit alpha
MLAVGVVAGLLGIPAPAVDKALRRQLSAKGETAIESGMAAVEAGIEATVDLGDAPRLPAAAAKVPRRWIVNGNDATGLGALRGGITFVAAYPITPATEILEWLSPRIEKRGGSLVQAEDELASINMAIGASFGGAPSLTATSGPGLALMIEGINLAVSAEVPVVVIDVMRGAPSTGIPTKSEQGDLNIAVHGLFGDAPHVVVAPTSIADCMLTTQWAVHLAEVMQVPAIVLSDQHLGQSRAVVDRPADVSFAGKREVATPDGAYQRYVVTESGVSPMALPGTPGGQYTADGLEHNPRGTPSSAAGDHTAQLDKRLRKVAGFDYGERWADVDGAGPVAVVTWGSMSSPVIEAARRLDPEGERGSSSSSRTMAASSTATCAAISASTPRPRPSTARDRWRSAPPRWRSGCRG